MAKVKVKSGKTHPIILKLTPQELEVVALLIGNTVLGKSNVYEEAASNLCHTIFESHALYELLGNLDEPKVALGWSLEKEEDGVYLSLKVDDALNRS